MFLSKDLTEKLHFNASVFAYTEGILSAMPSNFTMSKMMYFNFFFYISETFQALEYKLLIFYEKMPTV